MTYITGIWLLSFSGLDRAVGPVCVSVLTFEPNDL